MDSIKISSSSTKIVPDILKVLGKEKEENVNYSTKTNIRIKTHFDIEVPKLTDDLRYNIDYARNQLFKNQFRLPMKALFAEPGNSYICQKAPLYDKSNNIKNAARIIEPLNIGFDEYIRYIPINQNLEEDTTFIINVSVPYDSNNRYRFKSNQLVAQNLKEVPFDQNIDIGVLDIGSQYTGKFKVKWVNLDVYDSYTLFRFDVSDSEENGKLKLGFNLYTYEFMNVDLKTMFENVIKIIETSKEFYKPEFMKRKNNCITFWKKCIESLKK